MVSGKRWARVLLCGVGLFAATAVAAPAVAAPVWQPLAERVITHLEMAEAAYQAGEPDQARREVVRGYFGVFESEKMEAAMRTRLGTKHTYQVEKQFGELRKAFQRSANTGEITMLVDKLAADLRRDAVQLDEAGVPAAVFEVNR